MNKRTLVNKFGNWLIHNSSINIMHSPDFAKYEIDRLLKSKAVRKRTFEDEDVLVGVYEYEFLIDKANSLDSREHSFSFNAIGIGNKETAARNDCELAAYKEYTFILK